jgi:hypothetical protein
MGSFLAGIVTIHRASALTFGKFRLAVFAGSGRVRFFPITTFPAAPNSVVASPGVTQRSQNLTASVANFSEVAAVLR